MDRRRRLMAALAIGILLAAGIIAGVLAFSRFSVHADPFGSTREMWASLDKPTAELLQSNPHGYSTRLVNLLGRIAATKSKFAGSPRELSPFIYELDSIPGVRRGDLEGSHDEDRSVLLNSLTTIARAWFAAGPYRDGTTEFRVLHQALRCSGSDDLSVASQAALLLRVVSMRWSSSDQGDPLLTTLPTEAAERVRQIEEHPVLRLVTNRAILALQGKPIADITTEEQSLLRDWKPLGAP